jgi:flavin-dependent dehydrogenase
VQIDGALVTLRARVVVVAGGYGCRVADELEPPPNARDTERPRGIAMRGYWSNVSAHTHEIVFSLDSWVLPGYGWLFPLPDGRANIGIGTLVRPGGARDEHLRDLYDRYLTDPASPIAPWLSAATPDSSARSWPLDLGPRRRRVAANGLLAAGEAAALVGPMTGAGIAFALESGREAGRIAALALERGDPTMSELNAYTTWLRRHPLAWLRAESRAHWLVSDPRRLARLTTVTRPLPFTATLGARLLLHLG